MKDLFSANGLFSKWARGIDVLGHIAIVGLAFAIPISTALSNILMALVLICWLASGQYRQKISYFTNNPISIAALFLFAWLVLSLLWAGDFSQDQWKFLIKYSDLLLVTVFIWFLLNLNDRSKVLNSFAAAMLLTLALSYGAAAGLIPPASWLHAIPGNAVVFKLQITHSLLMSLAALIFGIFAFEAWSLRKLLIAAMWAIFCTLAVINVLIMVQGRTGYLVLGALVIVVFWLRGRWRGLAIASLIVFLGSVFVYNGSESTRQRIDLAFTELTQWQPSKPVTENNSIGLRLEFVKNSFEIASQRPLLGYGLGNFPSAYKHHIQGTDQVSTNNPHNDILLLAVQGGIPAVVLFFYLLLRMITSIKQGASLRERILAPALVIWISIGGLFNALLIDHTESLLFTLLLGLLAAATLSPLAHKAPSTNLRASNDPAFK